MSYHVKESLFDVIKGQKELLEKLEQLTSDLEQEDEETDDVTDGVGGYWAKSTEYRSSNKKYPHNLEGTPEMSFSGKTPKILTFEYYAKNKTYSEVNFICVYRIQSKLIEKCPSRIQDGRHEILFFYI